MAGRQTFYSGAEERQTRVKYYKQSFTFQMSCELLNMYQLIHCTKIFVVDYMDMVSLDVAEE